MFYFHLSTTTSPTGTEYIKLLRLVATTYLSAEHSTTSLATFYSSEDVTTLHAEIILKFYMKVKISILMKNY